MKNGRWLREAPFDEARRRGETSGGRPLCRWCGKGVAAPRRSWCRDACEQEYRIRSHCGTMRKAVFRRDRGICALCRLDTKDFDPRVFVRKLVGARPRRREARGTYLKRKKAALAALRARAREAGFTARHSPWEVDHILPVSQGGGACGLENLRTLCQPCHRRVTAQMRRGSHPSDRSENK